MSCVTRFTFLKGTLAQRLGLVLLEGELLYDTTDKSWYGGDGVTAGGRPLSNLTDEQLQDMISTFVQDSNSLDVIYDDTLNKMTLEVIQTSLDHRNLQFIGTNTHAQIDSHISSPANPHAVTKEQVGLGNADNTRDANKPVSTAQQTALNLKVDKTTTVTGTGSLTGGGDLSANRTINIADIVDAATAGTSLQIPVFTYNAKGQITGHTNTQIPDATQSVSGLMSAADKIRSDKMQIIRKTADQTFGTGLTLNNLTDLQFSAVAGKTYFFRAAILFSSSAAGNGISLTVQVPAGSISAVIEIPTGADGTAAFYQGNCTASQDQVKSTGVPAANTNYLAKIEGTFVCTTSGTVILQGTNEDLLINQCKVRANSVLLVQEIT